MTLIALSALAALAAGAERPADAPILLPGAYSMACAPTRTTGFRWTGSDWSVVEPSKVRFVITKQPSNYCIDKVSPELNDFGALRERDACLNRRAEGATYRSSDSGNCSEFYNKVGDVWETTITCWSAGLTAAFRPGGWYHLARPSTRVSDKPKDGAKADQILEVGKCTQVEPLKIDEDE